MQDCRRTHVPTSTRKNFMLAKQANWTTHTFSLQLNRSDWLIYSNYLNILRGILAQQAELMLSDWRLWAGVMESIFCETKARLLTIDLNGYNTSVNPTMMETL
jgi:hypothetical protein